MAQHHHTATIDSEVGNVALTRADIEHLGRQRPAAFSSAYAEIGFVFSLLSSMLMAEFLISGFTVVLPFLAVSLDIPSESRTWPAAVFSLVTGAFLLPFSRLGDMYGGAIVFNAGLAWLLIWSLIAGFSQDYLMLIFCRALQGLGPAAFLPTGIMLLGRVYRPGPRKNIIFSLYGAFAPLGFFFGIFIGGVTGQFLSWRWYFWIGSIILFITAATSFFALPRDSTDALPKDIKMDWWGVATIVPGLLFVVYAFTDAGHAPRGWATPNIYVTFVVGVLFLAAAVYVEGWVSLNPLMPAEIFNRKHMKPLILTLFMAYGILGLYLFYASFYMELVMHATPLQTAAWFAPMAGGGLVISTVGGFTLHLLPGRALLLLSAVGNLVATLLFALIPDRGTYWAFVFPAMVGATIGIDIAYNVTNVFITTNLPKGSQGQAGALINSLLFLGISFFLGVGDLLVTSNKHLGLAGSYKVAFWFGVALSAATFIGFMFIRIGSAKSELTIEENKRLESLEKGPEACKSQQTEESPSLLTGKGDDRWDR